MRRLPLACLLRAGAGILAFTMTLAAGSLAGPNAGGTLLVHGNPAVTYSAGESHSGLSDLDSCEDAITRLASIESPRVWFVLASFPPESAPSLSRVYFGIEYDESKLEIHEYGLSSPHYKADPGWPASGVGVRMQFAEPQSEQLVEVAWFAGTRSSTTPTTFSVIPYSDVVQLWYDGGWDPAFALGSLGFGEDGSAYCGTPGACCRPEGDCSIVLDHECDDEFLAYGTCLPPSPGSGDDPGNFCGNPGACCRPDGVCSIVYESECDPDSGFDPGAECLPEPCHETGACCNYWDFTCVSEVAENCQEWFMHYIGGVDCDPRPCPDYMGVCCYTTDCAYLVEEDCDAVFLPENPVVFEFEGCARCCCGPTLDSSWGKIKRRFGTVKAQSR